MMRKKNLRMKSFVIFVIKGIINVIKNKLKIMIVTLVNIKVVPKQHVIQNSIMKSL